MVFGFSKPSDNLPLSELPRALGTSALTSVTIGATVPIKESDRPKPSLTSVTTGAEVFSSEKPQPRSRFEGKIDTTSYSTPIPYRIELKPKPENPVEAYFSEHEEIKGEDDFMFLLWGSADSERSSTYAAVVSVPDSMKAGSNREINVTPWISAYATIEIKRYLHEERVFSSIRERYYASNGLLRRYLFFRKVLRVRIVNFHILHKDLSRFAVSIAPIELAPIRQAALTTIETSSKKINNEYFENEDPDGDLEDYMYRCVDCGHTSCDSYGMYGNELDDCPGRAQNKARDTLDWIKRLDLLTLYFKEPERAKNQVMLSEAPVNVFYCWKSMRYYAKGHQRDWHECTGLYVETCFDEFKAVCSTLALVVVVILVGKMVWGSWDIVFGAGSLFVAIPILVLTMLSYPDC